MTPEEALATPATPEVGHDLRDIHAELYGLAAALDAIAGTIAPQKGEPITAPMAATMAARHHISKAMRELETAIAAIEPPPPPEHL